MKTVFGFEETFPEPGIGLGMLIGWNLACLRSCRTNGGGLVKSGKWGLGGEEATCGGIRGSKGLKLDMGEFSHFRINYSKYFALRYNAIHANLAALPNRKELYRYTRIATALVEKIYFYRPHRSWEKALNENTNGLIRQYFTYKGFPQHQPSGNTQGSR